MKKKTFEEIMCHLWLIIVFILVALLFSSCAGYRPIDKNDLTQGFETYGFGRDIEVEFYENGQVKKIKATSNVGSTIKGADKFIDSAVNTAGKLMP